jgi:hypothetical protein
VATRAGARSCNSSSREYGQTQYYAHRGSDTTASIKQKRVLLSVAPLQAEATDLFPPSLEERAGTKSHILRQATRRTLKLLHSGVLFEAGTAFPCRARSRSPSTLLPAKYASSKLSNDSQKDSGTGSQNFFKSGKVQRRRGSRSGESTSHLSDQRLPWNCSR